MSDTQIIFDMNDTQMTFDMINNSMNDDYNGSMLMNVEA